jgi:hypothetical protein
MRTRSVLTAAVLAAVAGTLALAQPPGDATKPLQPPGKPALPEHVIPPGMSEEDMKACTEAMTPGAEHEYLIRAVGVWQGKTKMWMGPDTPATESTCTTRITSMMDGRYVKCEIEGEMPGMGPFNGFGIQGFDNVSKQYQTTWIDNCGTGIATGTGERSSDGKTMTWKLTYNCPITKKPTVLREIERRTGENTMTLEMHGIEPHTGKEFKMMEIAYTRAPKVGDATR